MIKAAVLMVVFSIGAGENRTVGLSQQMYSTMQACERARIAYQELLVAAGASFSERLQASKSSSCVEQ